MNSWRVISSYNKICSYANQYDQKDAFFVSKNTTDSLVINHLLMNKTIRWVVAIFQFDRH